MSDEKTETCQICGKPVITMCQQGTGYCGSRCEKAGAARAAEEPSAEPANDRSDSTEERKIA